MEGYEKFKRTVEAIQTARAAERSALAAKKKRDDFVNSFTKHDIAIIEICLTMLVTLNAVTLQYALEFCDMIKASETEHGRERFLIIQPIAKDGMVRSMNNRLMKLIRKYENNIYSVCKAKGNEWLIEKLSNSIDVTEDALVEPIGAYGRLITNGVVTKSSALPLDAHVLSVMIRCLILCDLSANIYKHISSEANYPIIEKTGIYKFMKMDEIYDQINKMISHIDFLGTDMKPLNLDINDIMFGKESLEISKDIMHIVYSIEYLNMMIEVRSGINPNIGNGEFKSLLPSFDEETLSIEQYKDKYRNMFISQTS